MALTATKQEQKKEKRKREEQNRRQNNKKMKWQMNNVRHKWLETVAKTHFASRETHPLGAIFWACELYLSLF
jgi:hypothetical protein